MAGMAPARLAVPLRWQRRTKIWDGCHFRSRPDAHDIYLPGNINGITHMGEGLALTAELV